MSPAFQHLSIGFPLLNGQLMYKGNYKDGKPDGPWVGYKYKDGAVWDYFTGTFKDGKKVE